MSGKILIVDDEKLIVKGLKLSLEQDGMECDAAYDGERFAEVESRVDDGLHFPHLRRPEANDLVCLFWGHGY